MSGNIYKQADDKIRSIWYSAEKDEYKILASIRYIITYEGIVDKMTNDGYEYICDL